MSLPCFMQVLCMTWFILVNHIRILVTFVHRINRQEEYCLSLARTLTSRYYSRSDDRMQIDGCVLRAPHRLSPSGFRGAPGGEHLSTHHALLASGPRASWAHPLPATPFQCPRSRMATLGEGAAATYLPLRRPGCTSSRLVALSAEEYDPGAVFEDDPT